MHKSGGDQYRVRGDALTRLSSIVGHFITNFAGLSPDFPLWTLYHVDISNIPKPHPDRRRHHGLQA